MLWPFAPAAPWISALEKRTRLRIGAAVGLMAAALAPRVANAFGSAAHKTDIAMFALHGPVDALVYALAMAGMAGAPYSAGTLPWVWPAPAAAALLILAALLGLWRTDRHQLRHVLLVLVLLALPVLALLVGGHGVRDRHVFGLQLGISWCAALGLATLIASRAVPLRMLSGLALAADRDRRAGELARRRCEQRLDRRPRASHLGRGCPDHRAARRTVSRARHVDGRCPGWK